MNRSKYHNILSHIPIRDIVPLGTGTANVLPLLIPNPYRTVPQQLLLTAESRAAYVLISTSTFTG